MNNKDYVELAMRTNDGGCTGRLEQSIYDAKHDINYPISAELGELVMGCLGLSGEVGELVDMVKKNIFHNTPIEETHFKKELGDIMWYIALICHTCNYDLDEILEMNISKLKARYPQGFNIVDANNRAEDDV